MIVEGVNVAVSMAECAVSLFEAQAQNWETETDGGVHLPDDPHVADGQIDCENCQMH